MKASLRARNVEESSILGMHGHSNRKTALTFNARASRLCQSVIPCPYPPRRHFDVSTTSVRATGSMPTVLYEASHVHTQLQGVGLDLAERHSKSELNEEKSGSETCASIGNACGLDLAGAPLTLQSREPAPVPRQRDDTRHPWPKGVLKGGDREDTSVGAPALQR